ncbi:fungal hydrophobin [Mycena amicta]|nr:fungal hydrophobin [Mycena amicta]
MFNKLAIFALFTLAAAAPNGSPPPPNAQCCSSLVTNSDPAASFLIGLLGIVLNGVNVPVALSCSPITVIGNNCGGTTVTCQSPVGQYGGLISINCVPITL